MSGSTIEKRVKVTFDANGVPLKQETLEIQKALDGASKTASNSGGIFSKFGADVKAGIAMGFGMSTVGMVSNAIGLVKDGISKTVEIGAEYEATMSQVKAITNATGAEMEQMSGLARELGANTVKSASEAGEAMVYMGMAGWDTQQIMAGLPSVLNLAIASGSEFGRVSDIVTDNLTAFGMEAEDASYYADVLAYAMSNANVNMETLGESLKYIAPVASGAGVAMEETVAMVSLLGDAGIKGSQAGTTLRSVILNLTGANAKATDKLKELGVAIYDSEGNMRSMADIIGDLSDKLVDANGNVDTTTANLLVGKTAVSGFTSLLRAGGDQIRAFSNALEDSTGTADRMASTMANNVQGAWAGLKSALEETAISLYDKVQPALKATIEGATGLVRAFNGMEEASDTFTIFGQTVSESTYEALKGTEALTQSIENQMATLELMGGEVTPNFVSTMLQNYGNLKTGIVDTVNKMHDEELASMLAFGEERLGMNEEQLKNLHASMDKYRADNIAKATELENRLKEIMAQYDGEETTMTREHQQELLDIKNEFKKLSIDTMTSELDEKKNLLNTYANESFKITESNAKSILDSAVQHKTSIVQNAQKRLDEELNVLGNMYKLGQITDKEYSEMVKTAQSNYDDIVSGAEESFDSVVKKIQDTMGTEAVMIAKQAGDDIYTEFMASHKRLIGDVASNEIKPVLNPKGAIQDAKNLISELSRIFSKQFSVKATIEKTTVNKTVNATKTASTLSNRSIVPASGLVTESLVRNNNNTTSINFNGQYSFANRSDMDYFMRQTARIIDRTY